jgi:hypothetical protein
MEFDYLEHERRFGGVILARVKQVVVLRGTVED